MTDIETRLRAVPWTHEPSCEFLGRAKQGMCCQPVPDYPALAAVVQGMVEVGRQNMKALATEQAQEIERLREALREIQQGREWSHATYNGGHTGEKCEAFHHGMDTVYNVIDDVMRRAALRPTPEAGAR